MTNWDGLFAPYDANGHYARTVPVFDAFSFSDDAQGGTLIPKPTNLRGSGGDLQTGLLAAVPGWSDRAAARCLGSVCRLRTAVQRTLPPVRDDRRDAMRVIRGVIVVLAFALIGAVLAAVITSRADSGDGSYLVRAVFDNSSFVIPGEDVKVAGVKVGTIQAVGLTSNNKAAITLEIDDPRFEPFRADAHCEIGLESLLGEQFVQCTPSQPVAAGAQRAPVLPSIASGPDKGQHVLGVQNTTTPVGLDQFADITRLPQQQRLQIIISGLGAGLAGNGHELNAALLRADPALQQTDQAIAVLSSQNRVLARLTGESDRILKPLAAQRAHVGGFIKHVATVAGAAAAQGAAIEDNLRAFPPFLRQLKPAAVRLTRLSRQIDSALQPLGAQAPSINASLQGLGPLATSGIPAVKTLGNVAQRGESTFPRINGVVRQLLSLAKPLQPLASNLAALSSSFDNAGGIEDVMRFIYYYTGAVNGEDALGHYVRSSFEVGSCSARSSSQVGGCGSTFATTTVAKAAAKQSDARRQASRPRRQASYPRRDQGAPRLPAEPVKTRRSDSPFRNPIVIGAITVLITVIAVALAYNANTGLPFVPTYNLNVELPDAAGLIASDSVLVGGTRVGYIGGISPTTLPGGSVGAVVHLKLDKSIEPLPADSTDLVRPVSPLGLKYLEIERGHSSADARSGRDDPGLPHAPAGRDRRRPEDVQPSDPRRIDRRTSTRSATRSPDAARDLNQALSGLHPLVDDLLPVTQEPQRPRAPLVDAVPEPRAHGTRGRDGRDAAGGAVRGPRSDLHAAVAGDLRAAGRDRRTVRRRCAPRLASCRPRRGSSTTRPSCFAACSPAFANLASASAAARARRSRSGSPRCARRPSLNGRLVDTLSELEQLRRGSRARCPDSCC